MQEINSVGLNSGFLASLAAFILSSIFLVTVDLMVLAAGTSMSLAAGLLASIAEGLMDVVDVVEELEEDEELVVHEEDEQELLSESESLCVCVVCPGVLPVVKSVSVCDLSVVVSFECLLFVNLSECL